jgi:sulfonate transport system substrate-binding protein
MNIGIRALLLEVCMRDDPGFNRSRLDLPHRRQVLSGLAALACVQPGLASAAALVERPAALPKPVTLRLGLFKGAYTAAFEDVPSLLKDTNLTLQTADFVRYADARTALVTGSLDIATISPGDLPVALSQGASNIVGLTGIATSPRYMVVRNGIKVEKWDDLIGKRIGIAPGSSTWFQFTAKLLDLGIAYGQLQTSNIQGAGSNFLIALKHGDLDVALTWEPFESEPVVEGYGYWPMALDFSDSRAVGADTGLIASTRSILDTNKDAVRLLMWAFLKAEAGLRADKKRFADVVARYTGASPVVAARIAGKIILGGVVDVAQLQLYAKTFYDLGALKRDASPDIASHFDTGLRASLVA